MKHSCKNRLYWLIFVLLVCNGPLVKAQLKGTYIANCEFLYQEDSAKVLIDPFGTEYGNYFYLPTNNTLENSIQGNAPFDHVGLVLITHIHGDHFNPFLAERFLIKNPESKMICPVQVYKQMQDSCSQFKTIAPQILSPVLNMNESKEITANNIAVTIIRMQHGTKRSLEGIPVSEYTDYEKTENWGYIIHFKKHTIFHQGDACLKINATALKNIKTTVDIAHLSYFDWDSTSYAILKNQLKASEIIFMHGTIPGKEFQTEELTKIKSDLLFFNHELESKMLLE